MLADEELIAAMLRDLATPAAPLASIHEVRLQRQGTCQHEWIELGNHRWCTTSYDRGGCAASQQRKHTDAPWT